MSLLVLLDSRAHEAAVIDIVRFDVEITQRYDVDVFICPRVELEAEG
jgi:hypothetical protein